MNEISNVLSIIAYYFSEYNEKALEALGYSTYKGAFTEISSTFGRENEYLKFRRDEFDALPESSSSRVGFRNRQPTRYVVEVAAYLRKFSFSELTAIVRALISNEKSAFS